MGLDVVDLLGRGPIEYTRAWEYQRQIHADVSTGVRPDTVLMLEHASVYTAGKRTEPHERPADGTPVIEVDRGGKITWHGPGQLVGYPIVRLPEPIGVVDYVRRIEEALIALCSEFGLATGRVRGRSGVWLRRRRRASGAQDRGHRRPGVDPDDDARLRAERRAGPARVRRDHPVWPDRRRRHLTCRRAGCSGCRRRGDVPTGPAPGRDARVRSLRPVTGYRVPFRSS